MAELRGICVPVCTPFDKSGDRIDETALRTHVDSMIEAGVHIIVSAGGTGEFAYMTEEERRRIHAIVGKQAAGWARFIAHHAAAALLRGADARRRAL